MIERGAGVGEEAGRMNDIAIATDKLTRKFGALTAVDAR